MSKIGENIKEIRKIEQLTQREVAKFLEVSLALYQQKENGVKDFSENEILKIGMLFGSFAINNFVASQTSCKRMFSTQKT